MDNVLLNSIEVYIDRHDRTTICDTFAEIELPAPPKMVGKMRLYCSKGGLC